MTLRFGGGGCLSILSADGHRDCFCFQAVVNTAVCTFIGEFLWARVFSVLWAVYPGGDPLGHMATLTS